MSHDDAQEIRRMLEDRIEQVLDALNPGWVKKGGTAYLTPKGPKDLGSFTVSLKDGKMPRGCFYRFSQSIGGGSVELVSYLRDGRKDSYKNSFEWARDFLGIKRSEESNEDKEVRRERNAKEAAAREEKAKRDAAEDERKKQKRVLNAQEVWDETRPLTGTLGEQYLIARGIPPISEWPWDPDKTLRFHPALEFEPDIGAGRFPAIVCKVVDAFGALVAIWQIYLCRDKPEKADLSPSPKIGRGPAKGGAVRIGGEAANIGGAEGMESALAAWALEGFRRPVWAFLSTSGMTSFEPPVFVEKLTIWPDSDKGVMAPNGNVLDPPGIKAARELQKRMKAVGITCSVNDMCLLGDSIDLLATKRKYEKANA